MAESLSIKRDSTETSLDVRIIELLDADIHVILEKQRLSIDTADNVYFLFLSGIKNRGYLFQYLDFKSFFDGI